MATTMSGTRWAMLCVGLCLGCFIVALDTSIIATAIPSISTQFDSLEDVGWYASAYLLTLTALQPIFGKFYTYFDVRWIFLLSILMFEVGSVVCAAAPSSMAFIWGRALSGVGAAGVLQGALATINAVIELQRRPVYTALVGSMFGISACCGPIVGGALTDRISWRWCFWINLPIGGLSAFSNMFLMGNLEKTADQKLPFKQRIKQFDYLGGFLITASVVCLQLALQFGGSTYAWSSAREIGLLITFGILLVAFLGVQVYLKDLATIPLRLLRNRSLAGGMAYYFCSQAAVYTHTYYLPFYFQAVTGASAIESGIRIIPYLIPFVFSAIVVGGVVSKTSHYYSFFFLGAFVSLAGCALIHTLDETAPRKEWASFLVLAGLGFGIGAQLPVNILPAAVGDDDTAVGNAICIFFGQLGGTIALAISNSILVNAFVKEMSNHEIDGNQLLRMGATGFRSANLEPDLVQAIVSAYMVGLKRVYIMPMVVAALSFFVGFAIKPNLLRDRAREKEENAVLVEAKVDGDPAAGD